MKVILQQDVSGQGKKGQLVDVSDGYARNYLLPRNLAVAATSDALNAMKLKEKAAQKQREKDKEEARQVSEKLTECTTTIKAKAGSSGKLFGSVTSKEISESLLKQHNIGIDKTKILLTEQIKAFGSYEIKCKLGYEITGIINILIIEDK